MILRAGVGFALSPTGEMKRFDRGVFKRVRELGVGGADSL